MRERMGRPNPKRAGVKRNANVVDVGFSLPTDPKALRNKIADLEAENASLKLQLAKIRDQPKRQPSESDLSDRERRHLFMKYSNIRRY